MNLPADIRARMIAANADLIVRELSHCDLAGDGAKRLVALAEQLREHAIALADAMTPRTATDTVERNAGSNVIALRRHG